MEMQINKENFYDSITKLRSKSKPEKEYSEGFLYLHENIILRTISGESFDISVLDLSKFTAVDLQEYIQYYDNEIGSKLNMLGRLNSLIKNSIGIFSGGRTY